MARETADREAVIQQLRDVGLRVTGPRLEVLQVLAAKAHLDVESITEEARRNLGTLTSQAVYDMLRNFLETGLVTKFERPGWPAVFEIAGRPHHHALCTRCGKVANVEAIAPSPPRKGLSGWKVNEGELIYKGTCPECRKN
ncbi:Fur family transcriptional regulator [Streptomyces sodiiphilus]|uniref:Fur family transcriptional regulator n=1 Tax=Streptomyces sodiiphilus TaxID=226217 RepID=A0ABP5A4T9_9ACTN